MANKVLLKKSSVAAKVPLTSDLEFGELAINYADEKLYFKNSSNQIVFFSSAGSNLEDLTAGTGLTGGPYNGVTAVTLSLANTAVTPGTYGGATSIPVLTVDQQGRITAASTSSISVGDGTLTLSTSGIATGSQTFTSNQATNATFTVNVPGTNIAEGTRTTTTVPITSSTGTGATLSAASTTLAGVMSADDKTKLDGIASGAEVNQNAFSNVAVSGQTTVAADSKTDTLTLVAGTNVTITTDAATDSITISANDSSVDWSEIQNKPDPVVTVTLTGDVTGTGNTTLTDLASGTISFATTIAANSVALGTDTTGNYVAGITSGTGIAVTGTAGEGWSPTVSLATAGAAGTYTKVTTDAYGRVTSGTTLAATDIPNLDASKITSGTIDAARLPSYVDDVLEYANLASFPATGETGKIYVALDTNKTYRWSGSAYVYITSGAVDSVNAGNAITVSSTTGVVTVNHADTSSQASVNNSGRTYIQDITLDEYGHITAITSATETVVDTNTTYSAGAGIGLSGTVFSVAAGGGLTQDADGLSHADTSTVANLSSDNANAVVIQDVSFTFDTYGHVTGASVGTIDLDGRYYTETESDNRFVNVTGDTMSGNLTISGTLSATAKSFLIPHPTKEGKKLRYGSLEGPENGVYVRGRLTGSSVIELPEYWTKLVDPDSITVNLTPIGKHQKLYVESVENNQVTVANDNLWGRQIDCFYTVYAERRDIDKLEVESD